MDWGEQYSEVVELLSEMGHTPAEIDKIMERLLQYEKELQLDSIMDSIGGGTLDLKGLIDEALEG